MLLAKLYKFSQFSYLGGIFMVLDLGKFERLLGAINVKGEIDHSDHLWRKERVRRLQFFGNVSSSDVAAAIELMAMDNALKSSHDEYSVRIEALKEFVLSSVERLSAIVFSTYIPPENPIVDYNAKISVVFQGIGTENTGLLTNYFAALSMFGLLSNVDQLDALEDDYTLYGKLMNATAVDLGEISLVECAPLGMGEFRVVNYNNRGEEHFISYKFHNARESLESSLQALHISHERGEELPKYKCEWPSEPLIADNSIQSANDSEGYNTPEQES